MDMKQFRGMKLVGHSHGKLCFFTIGNNGEIVETQYMSAEEARRIQEALANPDNLPVIKKENE